MVIALVCALNFSNAIILDCWFENFPFHKVGEIYRCSAHVIFDGENDDRITEIRGIHLPGKGNADVRGLIISSQELQLVPVNIESYFPDLKVLNLPINSLSTVTNKHLISFPNLEFLALFGNQITTLDSDLFRGLNSLRFVNLGRNRIKHVGLDVYLPPKAEIYMYSNVCVDQDAVTELEVSYLRQSLLVNCPPEPRIEPSSKGIANKQKEILKKSYFQLAMKVSFVEALKVSSKRCLNIDDPSVTL